MNLINIFSANSTTEAHLIQGLLAQHDIEAHISGHYLQGGLGELPVINLIQVMVSAEDEAVARDIIYRYEQGEFSLDDNETT